MRLLKLYYKIVFMCLLVVFATACKNTNEPSNSNQTSVLTKPTVTKKDIERIDYKEFAFSSVAKTTLANWPRFPEITAEIEKLKSSHLSFFNAVDNDDTIIGLFEDLKNTVPSNLAENQITVRLLVLETAFFKLEDLLNYKYSKQSLLQCIKNLLVAYSNLTFQINKKIEADTQKTPRPI